MKKITPEIFFELMQTRSGLCRDFGMKHKDLTYIADTETEENSGWFHVTSDTDTEDNWTSGIIYDGKRDMKYTFNSKLGLWQIWGTYVNGVDWNTVSRSIKDFIDGYDEQEKSNGEC